MLHLQVWIAAYMGILHGEEQEEVVLFLIICEL